MVKAKKVKHSTKKNKKNKKKPDLKMSKARRALARLAKKSNPAKKIKVICRISKTRKTSIDKPKIPLKYKKIDKEKLRKQKQIDLGIQQINDLLSQAYARQLLIGIGGENALAIVRNFSETLNDEELAKRLKIRISDVRATLNRLHNEGLVNYSRERDNESGWYSYTWSLNKERIREWINERSKNHRIHIDSKGDHYFCPSCGIETIMPFEKAVEDEFRCSKCERSLEFIDEEKANELFDLHKEKFTKK